MSNTNNTETGVFVNSDGLPIMYGTSAARDAVVGTTGLLGDDLELIVSIDWARLPAFGANDTIGVIYGSIPNAAIPDGAIIKSAVMTVDTAFSTSGTPTLDVGLVTISGATVTEVDNNGLIAGATPSTAGTVITGAGALINTKLAAGGPCYVWTRVGTANFTAGHGRLKIVYYVPTDELTSH